ncbi:MAG: glycosyltransferase [Ginsengibacter sp.]
MIVPTLRAGGSERIMSFLANQLNKDYFKVYLCVLDGKDPFYKIDPDHVSQINLNSTRARSAIFKIYKLVKNIQPDIVFSTLGHLNILIAFLKYFLSKKIKFVARESVIPSLGNKHSWSPVLFNFLTKIFYRNFHLIICQSVYMQTDLVNKYKVSRAKTIVIKNPVTIKEETPKDNTPSSTAFHFLSVGRLAKEKGYDRIFKALQPLKENYYYHIVGEGPELTALVALSRKYNLEEKIIFHGNTREPFKEYGASHLFLMGSYYEGFPNVLLEAGVYGMPVIAFNAPGGINEILVDKFNGFLVPDNEIAAYTHSIQEALQYNFDKDKIHDYINAQFNPGVILKLYEKTFSNLVLT